MLVTSERATELLALWHPKDDDETPPVNFVGEWVPWENLEHIRLWLAEGKDES